jgi:hypothetical protein
MFSFSTFVCCFVAQMMFLFAFFALLLPAYGINGFYSDNLFQFVLIWAVSIYAYEVAGGALSVMFDNPLIGMMAFMGFW